MKTLLGSDYFRWLTNESNLFSVVNILFGKKNLLCFRLDIIREVENQIELEHQIINSKIYQFYILSFVFTKTLLSWHCLTLIFSAQEYLQLNCAKPNKEPLFQCDVQL